MADDQEYDVGFGKPPKNRQFQKGRSGNPAGRPKGSVSLATILERELHLKVVIVEKGERRVITKLEAAIRQVCNKAAAGDMIALKQLHALVRSADESAATEPKTDDFTLGDDDEKIKQNLLWRLTRGLKETEDADDAK